MKKLLWNLASYVAAATVSLVTVLTLYELWPVDLSNPIIPVYHDALALQALLFKGMIENPWYVDNKWLGAPFTLNLRDFPALDYVILVETKFFAWFTHNHNLLRNIVALGSFPLVTVSSLFALRKLGVRYSIALAISIIYSFSNYHHMRLGGHLFLGMGYFAVPIATLLILQVFENTQLFAVNTGRSTRLVWASVKSSLWAILGCILIGITGMVYYPVFTCYLLLIASLVMAARTRSGWPLIRGAVLVGVIASAVLVTLLPTLWQNWVHGHTGLINRPPEDAERYALKIAQLLIPGGGHRLDVLRQLSSRYNSHALSVTENQSSYLGFLGVAGFLYLIFAVLRGNHPNARIRALAVMSLAAVLLATLGGFSSFISFTISSTIRSYNRICVYIQFFSLLAVALVLESLAKRWILSAASRAILYVALAVLTYYGVIDQHVNNEKYKEIATRYRSFGTFVAQIQKASPPGGVIYQMPYYPYNDLRDYNLLQPYLHSKGLRWSYGSSAGRRGDIWHSRVASLPTVQTLEALVLAGFTGIYAACDEYRDRCAAVSASFSPYLGPPLLTSSGGEAFYYSLANFAAQFKSQISPAEFEARRIRLMERPYLSWGKGFYGPNIHGDQVNTWGRSDNVFLIENPSHAPKRVVLRTTFRVSSPPATVTLTGKGLDESFNVGATGRRITQGLVIAPGTNHFQLTTDSDRGTLVNIFEHDPRVGMEDTSVEVELQ